MTLTEQGDVELRLAARGKGLHPVEAAFLGGQPTRQHDGRRVVRGAALLGRAGLVVPVVRVVAERELSTRNL